MGRELLDLHRVQGVGQGEDADRVCPGVALLSKLRGNGYFDNADHLKDLRTDKDLDPLRKRDDFAKLVNGPTKKAQTPGQ